MTTRENEKTKKKAIDNRLNSGIIEADETKPLEQSNVKILSREHQTEETV